MAHLNRQRATALMVAKELDALLMLSPESFAYATGASAGVAAMWRRAGAVAAVVPADPLIDEGVVITDLFEEPFRARGTVTDIRINPIWVETSDIRKLTGKDLSPQTLMQDAWHAKGRAPGFQRPETFDATYGFQLVADLLRARGLAGGRIGVELCDLAVADFQLLGQALPEATLVDSSNLVRRLKMVKSPEEIANLRLAVALAEAGISALQTKIAPGIGRDALAAAWKQGVESEARFRAVDTLTGLWEYISVGENPWTKGGTVASGSLIKVDVGCLISGYTSDTGRTFVCGQPSALQLDLFSALESAFNAGLAELKPGNPLQAVHHSATQAMANAGFPGYTRGHFGHGLGAGLASEEWPFISRQCDVLFEPGMVMAFETPWYIDGVGGMIIENQVLVTPDGHEVMNHLPTHLISV